MLYGNGHSPWRYKCTMDMDIHHGNAPDTFSCSMDMDKGIDYYWTGLLGRNESL
jgi:hypothetical protein